MTVRQTGARLKYGGVEWPLGEEWIVRHTCAWQPPTDVYEDDEGLVVQVEVAGMRSEDFSISLTGRTLVIAGTRTDSVSKQTYHQMEIRLGEFRVEVHLPWPVEPEDMEAGYENGFLKVQLLRPLSQRAPVKVECEED